MSSRIGSEGPPGSGFSALCSRDDACQLVLSKAVMVRGESDHFFSSPVRYRVGWF